MASVCVGLPQLWFHGGGTMEVGITSSVNWSISQILGMSISVYRND